MGLIIPEASRTTRLSAYAGDVEARNKDFGGAVHSGKRWRDDSKCGPSFPLTDGRPAECDPYGINPCCSPQSWCGNTDGHCLCSYCIRYTDTHPPLIDCPADIETNTYLDKPVKQVTWPSPHATDAATENVIVSCSHESGGNFTIGLTIVICEATDPAGNAASCSFSVSVKDTDPPVIDCPADIETNTYLGKPVKQVTWPSPHATDAATENVIVSCSHESGGNFTIGLTIVICEATDPAGNAASCSFNVSVKDTDPPVIDCPADIETNTYLGKPVKQVTWPSPHATDAAKENVIVSCNHESGGNFTIGLTIVICEATDPAGNAASCSFNVSVKGMVRPLLTTANETYSNLSTDEVITGIAKLSDTISALHDVELSSEESRNVVNDVLQVMDEATSVVVSSDKAGEGNITKIGRLISSVLNTSDSLSKLALRNVESGSGPVVFSTPSVQLTVESNAVENLTGGFEALRDGNGFSIPPAENILRNATAGVEVNRIMVYLNRSSFQTERDTSNALVTDILSLSFTDKGGNDLEVTDSTEGLQITFATNLLESAADVPIEGKYLEEANITNFIANITVAEPDKAVIILLKSSEAVYGNTTAYVFNKFVDYSDSYRGYQFSVDVKFEGDNSKIFIPERYFLANGVYYLSFAIQHRHVVKFSMAIKQTKCFSLGKGNRIWSTGKCKISSASNMTSTVCLCHLLPNPAP
ncbi:hyalin-like [Ptychodera flava]|uniref:hyalin-like n=1 Tax=Ptychodera flava TaxID=63121 RepID=UPI00396A6536